MFCTDFIFNGEKLSDHGLMICSFGSEGSQTGGDVTFTTIKPPSSDRHTYYTASFEEPLAFTFQIGKNMCKIGSQEEEYFTREQQSKLMRWLQRLDGYHWLAFYQEGWEDIWFHCQINLQPYYMKGRVIGYDVIVNTDSPYGYSEEITDNFNLVVDDTYTFENGSDVPGIIYPRTTIRTKGDGKLRFKSGCEENIKETEVINVETNDVIILDGDNDYFEGVRYVDYFNFNFPQIANTYDNINTYFFNTGTVDCNIEIKYRLARRVAI